jgi:hypothetical protein
LASNIGFSKEMMEEWNMTKQSKKKKALKRIKQASKSLRKSGRYAMKTRNKASDWIVKNINPDIYSNDADYDFDPWNPYGSKKKRR